MTHVNTVAEFESITARLYEVVSMPSEQQDWDSVRKLYHPAATMVRTGLDKDRRAFVLAMTFDQYVNNAAELLRGVEFTETEVFQEVQIFGNVARLASVYEYTRRDSDSTQSGRGVNFFNLVNDGHGWKIMNIVWDNERDGLSLRDAGLIDPTS